jgi:hypothetical protein
VATSVGLTTEDGLHLDARWHEGGDREMTIAGERLSIPGAGHGFADPAAWAKVLATTVDWLAR